MSERRFLRVTGVATASGRSEPSHKLPPVLAVAGGYFSKGDQWTVQ